jgi:hypothetical protein
VLRLILAFVDIMLHRRGPDSLPSSRFLLWAALAASLAADCLVLSLAGRSGRWFAVAVLVLGLNVWFVWALLRTFNRQPRFRQTMTALFGANAILTTLQAPIVVLLMQEPPLDPENPAVTLPRLIGALIILWAIDITSFVFSRALERPYLLCVAIVIGYALLIESLRVTLLQPVS